MTAIPEDVEARAKAAAHYHYRGMYSELSEEWAYERGYLACYTAERPRIELAALETIRLEVCPWCNGATTNGEHQLVSGEVIKCPAAIVASRITELRAEIERAE